ncbi:hypothetical protein HOK51_03975 [Candidatus Woesearchaeota archaeon]|jgi:hypothetical protein|nr:hypothetical protein [Candidatus Woesearchaeota archaeon]MBT6518981.1 hypothetical protein [Candidatus Woesearchaeota archaeon]MBT7368346.1 hypothetical protein [Candidatus Woesearchaeota archaeon]
MSKEDEFVELVLARLDVMPDNLQIHVGNEKEPLDKQKLIEHVKKRDKLGLLFLELQKEYIKSSMRGFT